jgi:alpha,alpha-trehalose phosphorylase
MMMEVADVAGNVRDGVHMAAAGGVWMGIVYGFAGMRERAGQLRFRPRLPGNARRIRFRLVSRGSRLEVDLSRDGVTYRLLDGNELTIRHEGIEVVLSPAEPVRTL